eukprot:CAMPEP_0117482544 /NCGR_PEP_ID=MMETSP0784-20121206/13474_1 /TAXON_ID=39447 /ORGANISM="" /LENGTH=572 /DNA_ID=CAMNT_0005277043 /DNA_START=100 /DNA_END=1818 /DNA_ORIENTATION=+
MHDDANQPSRSPKGFQNSAAARNSSVPCAGRRLSLNATAPRLLPAMERRRMSATAIEDTADPMDLGISLHTLQSNSPMGGRKMKPILSRTLSRHQVDDCQDHHRKSNSSRVDATPLLNLLRQSSRNGEDDVDVGDLGATRSPSSKLCKVGSPMSCKDFRKMKSGARPGVTFGSLSPSSVDSDACIGFGSAVPSAPPKASALHSRRRASCPLITELDGLGCGDMLALRSKHYQTGLQPVLGPQRRIKEIGDGIKIYDLYSWEEVLQEEGHGGKVVACRPKTPRPSSASKRQGEEASAKEFAPHEFKYVMKIKNKKDLFKSQGEDGFRKAQLRLLNLPPHDGVLSVHEVLEDDAFYYVVMEKAMGGSLFASLLDDFSDGNMPANAVRSLMCEILEAVGHIHKQGILHRDIKPDNLVVQIGDDPNSENGRFKKVKLIDFDVADPDWCPSSPTSKESTQYVGTLRHSAPESFWGSFSERSDLYSVGTILYLIMTGQLPLKDEIFDGIGHSRKRLQEIHERMGKERIDWSGTCWEGQPLCADLCKRLLAFDPQGRPASAEEALSHAWFTEALAPACP